VKSQSHGVVDGIFLFFATAAENARATPNCWQLVPEIKPVDWAEKPRSESETRASVVVHQQRGHHRLAGEFLA